MHGWSDWSSNLTLIAASVPNVISPAAVTFNEGTSVRIQWTAPAYDGGKPVLSYEIKILASDGSTYATDTSCDGSDATIKANLYCLVPMQNLRVAPFNLALGSTVVATVTATNVIGTNAPSTANVGGAVIKTEPAQPAAPVRVNATTTDLQLHVTFAYDDTSPANGGSSVTSAALYWDAGTN